MRVFYSSISRWFLTIDALVGQKLVNFRNVKINSIASVAFVFATLDCKIPFSPDIRLGLPPHADLPLFLNHALRIHVFRPTWPCLSVDIFSTQAKAMEPSGYFIAINGAFTYSITNNFYCIGGVMPQLNPLTHRFPYKPTFHIHLWVVELQRA